MIRYGSVAEKMRPMNSDDLLISRLKLLIIMAKAKLKGYPMGDYRKEAVVSNARFVFYESLVRSNANSSESSSVSKPRQPSGVSTDNDHLFLQRAQLLAVMMNAFVTGKSQGRHRKHAMASNIEHICEYLAEPFQLGNVQFLEVA